MVLRKRNIGSAISLIGAFALGQGSLFLASTYLLFLGRSDVVTELGISASMYSLVVWIADFGGIFYLSAYIKSRNRARIRSFFYARLACVLFAVLFAILAYVKWGALLIDRVQLFCGLCLALISCFGFGGAYDGIRRTSAVALYASLPWVFSAIGVLFFGRIEAGDVSETVGVCFLVGHSIYVLRTLHIALRLRLLCFSVSRSGVFREASGALSYLVSYAAGQFYARALLLAASGLLDPRPAAAFVYVRQIYSAISQVVLFLRRAEGVDSSKARIGDVLFKGALSSYFSIAVFALTMASVFALFMCGGVDAGLVVLVASSAICLLVWSYFNRLFFFYLGVSRLGVYLVLHSASMFILSVFILSVKDPSLVMFFPLVEAVVLFTEAGALVFIARRILGKANLYPTG